VPASGSFQLQFFPGKNAVNTLTSAIPYNYTPAQIQNLIQSTIINPYNNSALTCVVSGALSDIVNGISIAMVAPGAACQAVGASVVSDTLQTSGSTAVTFTVTTPTAAVQPSNESGPDMDLSGVYQLQMTALYGSTTNGSPIITGLSSTYGLLLGQVISGTGIPSGSTIIAIGSNQITLSQNATATSLNPIALSFTAYSYLSANNNVIAVLAPVETVRNQGV
jgi:hypothetical protein